MHVKISKFGQRVLNDRHMSSKIADAISHGKESFEKNGFVVVTNEKKETIGQITLVTSIPENSPSESK